MCHDTPEQISTLTHGAMLGAIVLDGAALARLARCGAARLACEPIA